MIIVIGLVLAFVLVLLLSNPRRRHCRWRENRSQDHAGQQYYKCATCGAEAFTDTGKPPLVCLRNKPEQHP